LKTGLAICWTAAEDRRRIACREGVGQFGIETTIGFRGGEVFGGRSMQARPVALANSQFPVLPPLDDVDMRRRGLDTTYFAHFPVHLFLLGVPHREREFWPRRSSSIDVNVERSLRKPRLSSSSHDSELPCELATGLCFPSRKERSGEFSTWQCVEPQHSHLDGRKPLVALPCRAQRVGEFDACNFDRDHLTRRLAWLGLLDA
jgi:hypothetical protein